MCLVAEAQAKGEEMLMEIPQEMYPPDWWKEEPNTEEGEPYQFDVYDKNNYFICAVCILDDALRIIAGHNAVEWLKIARANEKDNNAFIYANMKADFWLEKCK